MARGPLTSTSRPTLPPLSQAGPAAQPHPLGPPILCLLPSLSLSLLSRPQGLHLRRRRHSGDEDARPCSLVAEPDGPSACSWRGGRAWRRISEVRTQRSVAPPRPRRSGRWLPFPSTFAAPLDLHGWSPGASLRPPQLEPWNETSRGPLAAWRATGRGVRLFRETEQTDPKISVY
jgi:hypothetical protein